MSAIATNQSLPLTDLRYAPPLHDIDTVSMMCALMFEHLSLRFDFHTKIGDTGAAAVGRMLAVNTTLKTLMYDTTHNTVLSTGVWTV